MGFLDSLLGEEKRKGDRDALENEPPAAPTPKVAATPFRMALSFAPLRLSSMKANKVDLVVKLTNLSQDKHLVSVDAALPRGRLLGFDKACLNKTVERQVGEVGPGESVEVAIPVYASNQTRADDVEMEISAYAHYLGYDKVLAYIKRRATLRIV